MNFGPLSRMGKYFSEEEFQYYLGLAREYMASLDTTFMFFKVNKVLSEPDNIYGEGSSEETVVDDPITIPAIIDFQDSKDDAYIQNKGTLRYEEYGNLLLHVLDADLVELGAIITYGDYVGFRVSETQVVYFQVVDDNMRAVGNRSTMFGYRTFWKTITCAPIDKGDEFFLNEA